MNTKIQLFALLFTASFIFTAYGSVTKTNNDLVVHWDVIYIEASEEDVEPFVVQLENSVDGIVIDGIRWATRNVDAPGTFAESPESSGMLFQWNRRVGWPATDPMINSAGGTTWDYSAPASAKWERKNDPCPAGWSVPTREEFGDIECSVLRKNEIERGCPKSFSQFSKTYKL